MFDELLKQEFQEKLWVIGSSSGVIRALERTSEVKNIVNALVSNEIGHDDIEKFVSNLLKENFQLGYQFPYYEAIGAFAVAFALINEQDSSLFADWMKKYIDDLSKCGSELGMLSFSAKELQNRMYRVNQLENDV